MPTTIPYDPSLTLGNIVDPVALENLLAISAAQAPIDAAQDKMNSLIAMKRSLDMTTQEISNMGVDPTDLSRESRNVKQSISQAAGDYAKIRIAQEKIISDLKSKLQVVHSNFESPIDYNKTEYKSVPLSADSLKMDCQYFSFDENKQESSSTIESIRSFISESISGGWGPWKAKESFEASAAVSKQVSHQIETHNIEGTLIIAVTCTHKNATVLAPFILDVDKAIRVWNSIYKNNKDKLSVNDTSSMIKAMMEEGTEKEKFLNIISGTTFGSCFIGMVHILRKESSDSKQSMVSLAESMQEQFDIGSWFSNASGGFGVDASFSNDIKNMLSTQNITCHVNLVTMGIIPSIKSNQVQIGVKTFADFDPAKIMEKLAGFTNSTAEDKKTVASSAAKARDGAQMLAIQGSTVQNVMSGLATIDDGQNKILDINSMMTALEDYIDKAGAGNAGVPINYYLKGITKAQLANMWVSKYYPNNKYVTHISGDDKEPKDPQSAPSES